MKKFLTKKALIIFLIVSFIILGIAAGSESDESSSSSNETSSSSSSETVAEDLEIPAVEGMVLKEAKTLLKDQGFNNIEDASTSNETIMVESNWTVVKQTPAAGTKCSTNEKITLLATKTTDLEEQKAAENKAKLEKIIGKSAIKAKKILTKMGYVPTFLHQVTEMDMGDEATNPEIDFVVVSYDDPGSSKDITVYINTPENISRIDKQEAAAKKLKAKLDPYDAWQAAVSYGEKEYPAGFKLHYIMDKIAEEAQGDTWFLKAGCTIKNAHGAKTDATCEAKVTGTSKNPRVVSFYVY